MDTCRICGASETRALRMGPWRLVHCRECTITYFPDFRGDEELRQYYETSYGITENTAASTEGRRIFRMPEQMSLLADIQGLIPAPASVLDVGCDKGFFLDEARRFGYSVLGVEASRSARDYCSLIGVPAVASMDAVTGTFDVVTLWHTLEHITRPLEFLSKVSSHVRTGGYLCVRVPDFGCTWRVLLGHRWIWFQPQNHCFHFTRRALGTLLSKAGYDVMHMRSQRPSTALTDLALKLARRSTGRYLHARRTLRRRLAQWYENRVGVELYAIARRR